MGGIETIEFRPVWVKSTKYIESKNPFETKRGKRNERSEGN
jgi:hypothetical protein